MSDLKKLIKANLTNLFEEKYFDEMESNFGVGKESKGKEEEQFNDLETIQDVDSGQIKTEKVPGTEIVDKTRKEGDFDIGLIELSHIEDVAQNWRAAFDINNIFLAPGKFNRDQLLIDRSIKKQLNAFSKAKTISEKKAVIKELRKIEQQLIDKNLISKFGDRYFGVNKDSAIEANLLKNVEEAVDFTRYLADGGLVSFEEVLEYDNG